MGFSSLHALIHIQTAFHFLSQLKDAVHYLKLLQQPEVKRGEIYGICNDAMPSRPRALVDERQKLQLFVDISS